MPSHPRIALAVLSVAALTTGAGARNPVPGDEEQSARSAVRYAAPAGFLPASLDVPIEGFRGAILPNGRIVTPAGREVTVDAPKPYGLALSPDGQTLATINSGASRFSVTLVRGLADPTPQATRLDVAATFMGVVFSRDGARFYASGGENGNVWVGDTAFGAIVGSVNLNGSGHPLDRPLNIKANPQARFKGAFPGNMALSADGRYLYVVDQAGFQVHVIDTTRIVTGLAGPGLVAEPDNFAAVAGSFATGRYPYGIALSADGRSLFVTNVGLFQYSHLRPASPTGDSDRDYPLCYPAVGYPDETRRDARIKIKPVDPRNLPPTLRDADGVRCGYVDAEIDYTVPGLGNPDGPASSSVYAFRLNAPVPSRPARVVKTGPRVGEPTGGIPAYGGSHPNAVASGDDALYVANGNNDSISVLDPQSSEERSRVALSMLHGVDRRLRGIQPVALALSPDQRFLYVAEAGINAVGVLSVSGHGLRLLGHIPTGWWPSAVKVAADGRTLYVANARGRGAGPNVTDSSPKHSTMGTVSIVPVPDASTLDAYTRRVLANNGFTVEAPSSPEDNPIPDRLGTPSRDIKHVIFINKENSTHDQMLGDITATRQGSPVNGEPSFSLGVDASPNHHELALQFAFGDNFYLEPVVSSDGHRWLTDSYTTEFEETHWPASYGGERRDAGDDPAVFGPYPGRLGFTDANASPAAEDYNEHGGIYLHLARHGKSFVNFGNGYEFAIVDEDGGTEPTGIRQHVNVPMEKVVRDNSDHLYPEFNTHIPDAPLPEDPGRFNRFGRFKQVFEEHYVDRQRGRCMLPDYVDLYYPNDHGGGAFDINPGGPPWSYKRFVQDNDTALGLTVELVSNSPCWKDTVIFVVEDDTQNGLDHVDGHRSVFLAISPWVKREHVGKVHTSLASIFKTVELILGLPYLNQYDAAATDLREMFTGQADFRPYAAVPVTYARGASPAWLDLTRHVDLSRPDRDEVRLRAAILASEGLPRARK